MVKKSLILIRLKIGGGVAYVGENTLLLNDGLRMI